MQTLCIHCEMRASPANGGFLMTKPIKLLLGMGLFAVILFSIGCAPIGHYCHHTTVIVVDPEPGPCPDPGPWPQPRPSPNPPPPRTKNPPRVERTPDTPTRTKTGTTERVAPKTPVRGRGKAVGRSR